MVENPPDPREAGLEAAEVKTGHCFQGLEETAVDTAETAMVHALLVLPAADKKSTMYFVLRVVGGEIVGLVNWTSSSKPESAQEGEAQANYDQHGHVVGRELR